MVKKKKDVLFKENVNSNTGEERDFLKFKKLKFFLLMRSRLIEKTFIIIVIGFKEKKLGMVTVVNFEKN